MFTHDRPSWPIGSTAMVTLLINIAILSATTLPVSAAASVPSSSEDARGAAADHAVLVHAASLSVLTHKSSGVYAPGASAEQSAIEAASPTTPQRLDAVADSAAPAAEQAAAEQAAAEQAAAEQAAAEQAAAEQAAAEQHSASHTTEPDPAPAPADDRARAERAADGLPFDWRAHGITFKVGCHPDQSRCAWGTFDYRVNEVWLSSAAFASDARLRYVLAHELAHAWQWSTDLDDRKADLTDFGVSTSDGIEYGADCVAEAWGHPVATYWDCPSDAVAHMSSVFAATT